MCMTYSVVHGSNYLILYVYYYKDSETKDTCCSLPFALLYLIKYACCSMNNSSSQNCTYFNQESRITLVTAIRAAVETVSAVCCLLVVGSIVLFKKYRCFYQRLILYLAVAAFLHSLSYPLARVNYSSPRKLISSYCNFSALYSLYTSWAELLALCCLTFNVFLNAVLNKWFMKLEVIYLCLPYLLPLFWIWIPFLHSAYGNGEAWCYIRTIKTDCSQFTFGAILHFLLWYIPLYAPCLVMVLTAMVATCMIKRSSIVWYGLRDPTIEEKTRLLESEVRSLVWYPLIYSFLSFFSLLNEIDIVVRAEDPHKTNFVLLYLHVFTSSFRGAMVSLAYALDSRKKRRTTWPELKADLCGCCVKEDIDTYSAIDGSVGDSASTVDYVASLGQ